MMFAGPYIPRCPECGYEQYCPCKSCVENFPTDKKRWINKGNDIIACANCGYSAHMDKWEEIEAEQIRKVSEEFNKANDKKKCCCRYEGCTYVPVKKCPIHGDLVK